MAAGAYFLTLIAGNCFKKGPGFVVYLHTKLFRMKRLILALIVLVSFSFVLPSGDYGTIPPATVKKLDGSKVSTTSFSNNGKPMIISFWATWCKPCKKELDAVHENYEEWVKETGVKLIAISIDDVRSSSKVVTDVKSKGWEFEVYLDENSDFKRAMSVNNIPHTFLVDGKGKIVWSHNSYTEGDEEKLYENVKKLVNGETLSH